MSKASSNNDSWNCHCCSAKNCADSDKCRVCGRPESYVQRGYPLPYHGQHAKIFRPSQLITVLESVHEVDSEGMTSLHSACANGNAEIVKELLKFKSKVDVVTKNGHTPLHLAVYSGSYESVVELLKNRADVNAATNAERNTPLHLACEFGFGKVAEYLIQNGANVHATNVLKRTPLHSAATIGRTDIGMLLLRNGADALALDAHAWEPRQIAELGSHRMFQELMIREGMGEKQTVIKELPPAKWHGELWTDIVAMHEKRIVMHEKKKQQDKELVGYKQDLVDEKARQIKQLTRDERQRELSAQAKRIKELSSSSYYNNNAGKNDNSDDDKNKLLYGEQENAVKTGAATVVAFITKK